MVSDSQKSPLAALAWCSEQQEGWRNDLDAGDDVVNAYLQVVMSILVSTKGLIGMITVIL